MEFRTAWNRDHKTKGLVCGESLTDQSFKSECDINFLWNKYSNLGGLPLPEKPPVFADVTAVSYRNCQDLIKEINSSFDGLSSEVRAKFKNDPARLLDFLGDERNRDEAVRLGLVKPAIKAETQVEKESLAE